MRAFAALHRLFKRLLAGAEPARPRLRPRCEQLEDRLAPAVAAEEQLFVYLLNRARHNPAAYAAEQGLSVSLADVAPRPPLAIHSSLFSSAEFHAQYMADHNVWGHNVGGYTPNEMVRNAGYPLNSIFETTGNNVESITAGAVLNTAAEALNWLLEDTGLSTPWHRIHLMGIGDFWAKHREIGVGHAANFDADYVHYWVAHTGYASSTHKFLTGVVYHDANGNGRYDLNEGLGGVSVQVGGQTTTTNSAGGWSIRVTATGALTVQAGGGSFVGHASAQVNMGSQSIEVDFISGRSTGIVNFGSLNSPPVLNTSGNPKLPAIPEDTKLSAARTIGQLVGAAISDPDPNSRKGVAVVAASGGGVWQYSVNGGSSFQPMGAVSDTSARLLRDIDLIRFKPAANFNGTATLTIHAWDRTAGRFGNVLDIRNLSAFSLAQETITIVVKPVNDAPVLYNGGKPILPASITSADGATVASIIAGLVSDADAGAAQGIAVIGLGGKLNGRWQFFNTKRGVWVNLEAARPKKARLLRATDRVRFLPDPGFSGTIAIAFRAWDQFSGTPFSNVDLSKPASVGGKRPFSKAIETASRTI